MNHNSERHPATIQARGKYRDRAYRVGDLFYFERGIVPALVLADAGIPVAPMSADLQVLAAATTDVGELLHVFREHPTAMVAYNVRHAKFDFLIATCQRTLRHGIGVAANVWQVRGLIDKWHPDLPAVAGAHVLLPFPRDPVAGCAGFETGDGMDWRILFISGAQDSAGGTPMLTGSDFFPAPVGLTWALTNGGLRESIRSLQNGDGLK